MKNAAQFLGRFLLDRRGGAPRILEVRDHLDGVYLTTDGATCTLLTEETLADRIGDIFPNRERPERALGQVLASMGARANAPAPSQQPFAQTPHRSVEPPAPAPAGRNDPAFVDLVSAVLNLPEEHTRILHAMVGDRAYAPRMFTEGLLAGHEVAAINLMDAHAATGVDYAALEEAIVEMKKSSLVEVVRDALKPGRSELARFWIVVNPECIEVLACAPAPELVGLVA